MRQRLVLGDPVSALLVGSGVLSGVGALASAGATASQQEAQAGFARAQARRQEVQEAREQRDLRRESRRTMAQTRLALAGEGGGINVGAVLGQQAEVFGQQSARLRQDSRTRQAGLRARGTNLDAAAGATRFGGALSATSAVTGAGAQTLLSRGGG